jgi:DNA mismatch repair protein MutL
MAMANIQVLPPDEARKIAAGEVVDRPASLVRELLDNAIDAGSGLVEVAIEDGGVKRVEVVDNGCGMSKDDLALCFYAHATSKIRCLDDLNRAETLGFRGEALAAAAAVSALDILSSTDGREAWRLEVGPGDTRQPRLEQARRTQGTSVRCFGLFDTIPARKRFLKRDFSEAGLCYQTFVEKALAFPAIGFRFTQNNKLKTMLQPVSNLKGRFADLLLRENEAVFLHEIKTSGEGFSVSIVIGGAELCRSDRRQQYVFANGRRIQEFSLLQALEYGVQGVFPNGTHPVGAVFIDIEPRLADFNIHPAKREARFADGAAIHHAITTALRDFVRHWRRSESAAHAAANDSPAGFVWDDAGTQGNAPASSSASAENGGAGHEGCTGGFETAGYGAGGRSSGGSFAIWGQGGRTSSRIPPGGHDAASHEAASLAMEALLENRPQFANRPGRDPVSDSGAGTDTTPPPAANTAPYVAAEHPPAYAPAADLRYAGRVFDLFIMAERGDRLFVIDQHAAHERILFDEFLAKPIPRQELLVSIPFNTESDEDDRFLESKKTELLRLGIAIDGRRGAWRIEALPLGWSLGDAATVKAVLELRRVGENIAERWAATVSCHSAIKDGGYLDENAALALARAALALPVPFCPHGRPIWFEISREDMFKAVKRV